MRSGTHGKDGIIWDTPYGYKIEKGKAIINTVQAQKIRGLYENYLSGMALAAAAKAAGIETYHGTAKRLIGNRHYLGDEFYPAIVNRDTFEKAEAELLRRAEKLGRLNKRTTVKPITAPTRFHFAPAAQRFESPKLQAEYLYSLIESEVV